VTKALFGQESAETQCRSRGSAQLSMVVDDSSDEGSAGTIIQLALVAVLIGASVKIYLRRETAESPKWLATLLEADAKKALAVGLLVILLGASDIVVLLMVGTNLEHNNASLVEALPFAAATVLIAALPLLAYLLFRRRMERAMPEVRDWMNTKSWLVNILVYCIFIALILS
jgi:hypothetical protein